MATEGCARILYCLLHTAVVHPILPLRPKPPGSATCLQTEPTRDLNTHEIFSYFREVPTPTQKGGLTPPHAKRSPFLVSFESGIPAPILGVQAAQLRIKWPQSQACKLHSSGLDSGFSDYLLVNTRLPRVSLSKISRLGRCPRLGRATFPFGCTDPVVNVLRHLQHSREDQPRHLRHVHLNSSILVECREVAISQGVRLLVLVPRGPSEVEHHAARPQLGGDLREDDHQGELRSHKLRHCKRVAQVVRNPLELLLY